MSKKVIDHLFSARWAIKNGKNDYAYEQVTEALIDLQGIPQSIKEVEREEKTPVINDPKYVEPTFVKVSGVKFREFSYKTKSKTAEGLVVHYTVSGRSERSAIGVLKYLASKGYGCMVMDEDGKIYIPESFDIFRDAAAHAGKSAWNGYSGLNDEFMGMEICGWGRSSSKDEKYGRTRYSGNKANIVKGYYQPYTEAQEKALANFCLWAAAKNPHFKLENVCGHDEARIMYGLKGDKQDPGASLSMTMPEFREMLLVK